MDCSATTELKWVMSYLKSERVKAALIAVKIMSRIPILFTPRAMKIKRRVDPIKKTPASWLEDI